MIPIYLLIQFGFEISNIYIDFTGAVGVFIFTIMALKLLPLKKYYDKYKKILEKINFLVVNLIFFIIVLRLLAFYESESLKKNLFIVLIASLIYILLTILFASYNHKIKEQQMEIETYSKYSPIIFQLTDDIKSRQHDFKNHINTIYGIIQTSEEENLKSELENYITSLNNSLIKLDKYIEIDNKVIAAIIYSKRNIAKANNIEIIYNIDDNLSYIKLKDFELSEILNNLLDNSIKAVQKELDTFRKVIVRIGSNDKFYFIETENAGLTINESEVTKIFNKGFTTKKDENHGYGLFNVKKIVQSYNGKIEMNIIDRYLKISLYIPK